MTKINIAFGATKNWLQYTYVTICSILSNASANDEYTFYIMCDKKDEQSDVYINTLNKIKKSEFKFFIMDDSWFEGAVHNHRGVSTYYRLKLSSLTEDDKVLYLDSDLIALQDIADLFNQDIENYYVAGIEDKHSYHMLMRLRLKEPGEGPFINAGVTLMNLKKFRENKLEDLMFEKLRERKFYNDQDAINDVCRGNILSLPIKYNLMYTDSSNIYRNRRDELEEAVKSPVILHYILKPWEDRTYFCDKWLKYKRKLDTTIIACNIQQGNNCHEAFKNIQQALMKDNN